VSRSDAHPSAGDEGHPLKEGRPPASPAAPAVGEASPKRERSTREAELEAENLELRRGREELEASLDRYRELYDFAPVGYLTLDQESAVLELNLVGAAMLGCDRSRILGQGLTPFIAPRTRPAFEAFLAALHRSDRASCELTLVPPGGSHFDVQLDGVREQVGPGRGWRCRAVLREVTDRRAAPHPLSYDEPTRSEFLGLLAHRLRDPLAPIHNSLYLLERAQPGSEQALRAKNTIQRQTDHLARLVQDLLDVTRLSHGKIALQRSRFDLRSVVRRATEALRSLFDQSGVGLCAEYGPAPVWVNADEARMAQAVSSLLHNAAKFTPSGGTVSVEVAQSEGRAKIRVKDSGIGMTQEEVERMFELFEQAEPALSRSKGGFGLGLALVKGLVELHGGSVLARSDGPGRGSEFEVTLRLSGAAVAQTEPEGEGEGPRPRRVLVIDDNVDAGRSLADVLELHGYDVRVVREGRSGIAVARASQPEVVICDIGLPDVDGYEVARTLRADGALRGVRLIALSGFAQQEDRQRAELAGFDAHLSKPSSPEALLAAVGTGKRSPGPGGPRDSSPEDGRAGAQPTVPVVTPH